jgi:hypothetical protein
MAFLLGMFGIAWLIDSIISDKPPQILVHASQHPDRVNEAVISTLHPPPSTESYRAHKNAMIDKYVSKRNK